MRFNKGAFCIGTNESRCMCICILTNRKKVDFDHYYCDFCLNNSRACHLLMNHRYKIIINYVFYIGTKHLKKCDFSLLNHKNVVFCLLVHHIVRVLEKRRNSKLGHF